MTGALDLAGALITALTGALGLVGTALATVFAGDAGAVFLLGSTLIFSMLETISLAGATAGGGTLIVGTEIIRVR